MSIADRIRVKDVRLLSDNHYTLKTTTFEWRRANGEWQTQHRESYDRGNGATLLPYSLKQRTVVLVRQFRYVTGRELWEIPAGTRDHPDEDVEATARRELREEAGLAAERWVRLGRALLVPGYGDEALAMIGDGRIVDAKTIMLLQYAALNIFR